MGQTPSGEIETMDEYTTEAHKGGPLESVVSVSKMSGPPPETTQNTDEGHIFQFQDESKIPDPSGIEPGPPG